MTDASFVDRKNEFNTLLELFKKVVDGKGQTVFVFGEPGIGKTCLCEKFCSSVQNGIVLRGFVSEESSQPYQPIVQALGEYFNLAKEVVEKDTERIMEIIKKRHALISGSEEIICNFLSPSYTITKNGHEDMQLSRMRMFEIVARLVQSIATEQPLILFMEDLHWADKSTWNLIHYLARNIEEKRVMILGTYRNDEMVIPKTGEVRPILDAMQRMRRERIFHEIPLSRFSEKDTEEFVKTLVGGEINPELIKNLHKLSEGVPLILKEYVEHIKQDNCDYSEIVPESYNASILKRLRELDEQSVQLVQLCAVIGERIEMDILINLLSIDEDKLLEMLEKLCKANILMEIQPGEYKFVHNLMRKAIYQNIPDVIDIHLRVASAMESVSQYKTGKPHLLAYHYMKGNDLEKSAFYSIEAGELALRRYAIDEAKHLLERGVELLENKLDTLEREMKIANALMNLGNIQRDIGKLDDAKKSFDRVLRLAFDIGSKKLASEAYRRIGNIFETKGKYDAAFAHYKKALETAIEARDIESIAYAYEALGGYSWRVDKLEEAERFLNACLENAIALGDNVLIARCHTGLGNIDFKTGKYQNAIEHFETALKTLPEKEVPEKLRNLNNIAVVFTLIDKFDEAEQKYTELINEGQKYGLIRHIAYAYGNLAAIYSERDMFDKAIEAGNKSIEFAQKINDLYCMTMAKTSVARAMGKKGDVVKYMEAIDEAISIFNELGLKYDIAALYFDAADTMYYLQKFDEGNQYLKKSIEIGKSVGAEGIFKKIDELKQKYGDKIKIE